MFNGFAIRSHFVAIKASACRCGPPVGRWTGSAAAVGRRGTAQADGVNRPVIFRTTFGAFLMVLVSLTAVIWLTQALRDVDLMTGQGQTILVFIGITSLIIPQLVMVIAPVALVVAVAYILHKLATDSEIIVMNGAGMPPWRIFCAVHPRVMVVAS